MNRLISLALIWCVSVAFSLAQEPVSADTPAAADGVLPVASDVRPVPAKVGTAPSQVDPVPSQVGTARAKVIVTVINAQAKRSDVLQKVVEALEKSGIAEPDIPAESEGKRSGVTARIQIQQDLQYEKVVALVKALQYAGVQYMAFTKPSAVGKNIVFLLSDTPHRNEDIHRIERAAKNSAKECGFELQVITAIPPQPSPATGKYQPQFGSLNTTKPHFSPNKITAAGPSTFGSSPNRSPQYATGPSFSTEFEDVTENQIDPNVLRAQIVKLQSEYETADGRVNELAASLRKSPDTSKKAELKNAVMNAFRSRQELLQSQLLEMQIRLIQTQASLKNRNRIRSQIVDRRVHDLLNPQSEWDNVRPAGLLGESQSTANDTAQADTLPVPEAGLIFPTTDGGIPGLRVLGDPDEDGMVEVTFQPSPHSSFEELKQGQIVFVSQTLRPTSAGSNHTPIVASGCVLKEFGAKPKRSPSNQPVVLLVNKNELWELIQAEKRGALEVHPQSLPKVKASQPPNAANTKPDSRTNAVVTIVVRRVVNDIDIGDLTVGKGIVVSASGLVLIHIDDSSYFDHKDIEAKLQDGRRIPLGIAEKSDCGLLAFKPKTTLPTKLSDFFPISTATFSKGDRVYIHSCDQGMSFHSQVIGAEIFKLDHSTNLKSPVVWRLLKTKDMPPLRSCAVISAKQELIGIPVMRRNRSGENDLAIPATALGSILPDTFGAETLELAYSAEAKPLIDNAFADVTELEGSWHQVAYSDGEGISHEKHIYNKTFNGNRATKSWSGGRNEYRIELDPDTKTIKYFVEGRDSYSIDYYRLQGDQLVILEPGFVEGDRVTVYQRGFVRIPTLLSPATHQQMTNWKSATVEIQISGNTKGKASSVKSPGQGILIGADGTMITHVSGLPDQLLKPSPTINSKIEAKFTDGSRVALEVIEKRSGVMILRPIDRIALDHYFPISFGPTETGDEVNIGPEAKRVRITRIDHNVATVDEPFWQLSSNPKLLNTHCQPVLSGNGELLAITMTGTDELLHAIPIAQLYRMLPESLPKLHFPASPPTPVR